MLSVATLVIRTFTVMLENESHGTVCSSPNPEQEQRKWKPF